VTSNPLEAFVHWSVSTQSDTDTKIFDLLTEVGLLRGLTFVLYVTNNQSCCTGYWYWYLYLHAKYWYTCTGTCEKVLVAKTKSFSAVIDKVWHLYSETECLDYWFLCPSFTIWHYLADLHFISFLTFRSA